MQYVVDFAIYVGFRDVRPIEFEVTFEMLIRYFNKNNLQQVCGLHQCFKARDEATDNLGKTGTDLNFELMLG